METEGIATNGTFKTHEEESDRGCFHVVQIDILLQLQNQLSTQLQAFHHDDDVLVIGMLETMRDIQYRTSTATTSALEFYRARLKVKGGAA